MRQEDECFIHKGFSKYRNIGSNAINFCANKYLIINNWNQKSDPIFKLKDMSVYKFQEESEKKEIIEKMNELIKLLKDEGTSSSL